MSETIKELRLLTDEELIEKHDKHAAFTNVGVNHYLDELRSREQQRINASMRRMTQIILWLTGVVTLATLLQVGVFIAERF